MDFTPEDVALPALEFHPERPILMGVVERIDDLVLTTDRAFRDGRYQDLMLVDRLGRRFHAPVMAGPAPERGACRDVLAVLAGRGCRMSVALRFASLDPIALDVCKVLVIAQFRRDEWYWSGRGSVMGLIRSARTANSIVALIRLVRSG
jgi:hypothetical protein